MMLRVKVFKLSSIIILILINQSCGKKGSSSGDIIDPKLSRTDLLKLELISPDYEGGTTKSIRIKIKNTRPGEKVRLFNDQDCKNQIALGTASSDITMLNTSPLTEGLHQIRAKSSNSGCSDDYVEYFYVDCPENFVFIRKNAALGVTTDFCVSKYEMKCTGPSCDHTNSTGVNPSENAKAASLSSYPPWSKISQTDAKLACDQLGEKYDLISNPEWMTIAYEIENNPENWTGEALGEGILYRGHSDGIIEGNISGGALEASLDEEPYFKTGNDPSQELGKDQKRTMKLKSGEVIWDFSGNLWEWTNWELDEHLTLAPTTCNLGTVELPLVDCNSLLPGDYLPDNPKGITPNSYNSDYGLGVLFGGSAGTLARGGISSSGTHAGIFALDLNFQETLKSAIIGFRCVYRPVP